MRFSSLLTLLFILALGVGVSYSDTGPPEKYEVLLIEDAPTLEFTAYLSPLFDITPATVQVDAEVFKRDKLLRNQGTEIITSKFDKNQVHRQKVKLNIIHQVKRPRDGLRCNRETID